MFEFREDRGKKDPVIAVMLRRSDGPQLVITPPERGRSAEGVARSREEKVES